MEVGYDEGLDCGLYEIGEGVDELSEVSGMGEEGDDRDAVVEVDEAEGGV